MVCGLDHSGSQPFKCNTIVCEAILLELAEGTEVVGRDMSLQGISHLKMSDM